MFTHILLQVFKPKLSYFCFFTWAAIFLLLNLKLVNPGRLVGCIWDLGQGSDFSSAYKAKPALPQPLSMKQSVSQISALLWYNLLQCALHIYQLNLVLPTYLPAYPLTYLPIKLIVSTHPHSYIRTLLPTILPQPRSLSLLWSVLQKYWKWK